MLTALLVVSCTPFDELEDDPNSATNVPPSMLLSGVLKNMADEDGPWSEAQRDNQFWVISFDYNGDQDYNWGSADFKYDYLSNVEAMNEEAQNLSTVNKYGAIAKFLRAYYFDYMSRRLGDIPLTEALMADADISIQKPVYDSQQAVYEQVLTWLDEANTQIAQARNEVETGDLEGDFSIPVILRNGKKQLTVFTCAS